MTATSHRATFDIPVPVGHGDCRDTVHVKADVDYNYTPGRPDRHYSADIHVFKCTPLDDASGDELTCKQWKELAQDHLDDGGYDHAIMVAKEQRGEN